VFLCVAAVKTLTAETQRDAEIRRGELVDPWSWMGKTDRVKSINSQKVLKKAAFSAKSLPG
jgi:hypothetical protein